jgi:tRNA A-37 threonylcarbamoyl transferase component Bud32/TolB-like protein
MTTPLARVQSALADRYSVTRELGAGGMAVVYLGEDRKHGRRVAIKVLRPEIAAALGAERFLREIGIAAGLRHPHIVPLYDSGESDGLLYYVMPAIEGESLRARLERERQLPLDDAIRITGDVADALAHAHAHGLIHRDIKPENILLEGEHALLADFGIARAVDAAVATRLTATGLSIGTPAYMSPEQALGEGALDARSDIYALGCVLYEMLVGQPPLAAPTAQAILARRLNEPVPSLRPIRETVSPALESVILTALARVPADRFATAVDFRNALTRGDARRRSVIEEAPRTWWRPRVAVLSGAVVLLLLAGAALMLAGRDGQRSPSSTTAGSIALPGIAVLPFRSVGAEAEVWHEGVVHLLSHNLEGVGELRKIDPVSVLTEWSRLGGSASVALSGAESREIGRRLGGRYVITGSAVRAGGDVQVVAEVHDVGRDEVRGSVRVARPADSVSSLVDALTVELLRQGLLPTDGDYVAPSLARLTTTSLPALKAYLAGESEYRRARWSEAARHFERAVELDSTFTRALFRLSQALGWSGGSLAGEYGQRALLQADRLPPREAMLIRAIASGDIAALEALTERYPDDLDAWLALGDQVYHAGGVLLRPTDSYRSALGKALALHPHYGEAYIHLIEDAFLRLDSADARQLIAGYDALGGIELCPFDVSHDLVWGRDSARVRATASLDTMAVATALSCVQAPLAADAPALDRIATLYQAGLDTSNTVEDAVVLLWRLLQVRIPRGQISAARAALARAHNLPSVSASASRWQLMMHLSGFPDSVAARDAAARLARAPEPIDLFWLGALAAAEERGADIDRTIDALRQHAAGMAATDSAGAAASRAFAGALDAYSSGESRRGRDADFETALAALPSFGWDLEQPQQYLRFQKGKMLFEEGRLAESERYFRTFRPYDYFYTSPAELYLGRITEALGRADEAAVHYARFVRWWEFADRSLRPQWEEARAALRRLAAVRE